jgi:hypothetical protein
LANRRIRRTRNFAAYLSAINQDISRIDSKPRVSGLADGIIAGSSLSSSVVLENNFIQSGNYLPGFTGWKIDSNGVAEFGSVFVRGHIDAQTGSIGYWNISTPVVERTFGNRQLFGTFLESRDLGISDNTQTEGSYVGLFKSYSEEGMSITHKYRFNNVATLTVPDHGFENGDYVNISIEDGDTEFATGESTVRIFNVTKDAFSYVNVGDDFTATDLAGDYQEMFTYGTATLYVKDVAGLYLQDYGRALFDYGYFSNEGIAYVSAETPNLIYNASFEYADGGSSQSILYSWLEGDNALSIYDFSSEDIYSGDSTYAGRIEWDGTASSNYLHAKVNSSEFKRLDFYRNNRELYLNFEMFFTQALDKVTIPTTSSFVTTSSSVITITCPGHGLAINDLVYFDFNVSDGASYTYYTNTYRLHTVLSVSGNSFTVQNKFANTTANPITLSAKYSTNPCIFKYTQPILDLNDIKISFVTAFDINNDPILDSTTSLYDVLTDVTIANWSDYRYWSMPFPEFENWYSYSDTFSGSPNVPYRPLSKMNVITVGDDAAYSNYSKSVDIKISSSKIEGKYRSLASNQYIFDGEFYLSFPEWIWEGTEYSSGNTVPTKRAVKAVRSSGMGYLMDNVSISPSRKFFYGSSGSSSFYYAGKITDTNGNAVSYEEPRQWIDIDLDFQTAQFKYIDSIEFKSTNFLKQLFINPSINTIKESTTVFGSVNESLTIGQSSVLNISSGAYKYADPTADDGYRTIEAFSSQETGTSSAVYQIRAISSNVPVNNQVSPDGRAGSTLMLSVSSDDSGQIAGYADRIKYQATKENLLSVNGYANTATHTAGVWVLNGVTQIYGSPNVANVIEPTLWIGGDGGVSGFRQAGDSAFVLGVTHEALTSKIQASGVFNNELISDYQAVYISNISNELGYVSSSITTKKNVEPLQLSIDSILAAEPVQFNYKSEEDGSAKHAGFIAEQLVDAGLGGYVSFGSDGNPKSVNYEMFVSALQSVVRYQASQITNLEDRITRLEDGNV